MGTTISDTASPLGPHGILDVNERGDLLHEFLTDHALCSLTSFFDKPGYGTWHTPGNPTRFYQIDFAITEQRTRFLFRDSGLSIHGADSDHTAILSKLHTRRQSERAKRRVPSTKLRPIDFRSATPLQNELYAKAVDDAFQKDNCDGVHEFCDVMKEADLSKKSEPYNMVRRR
jgi:hypothetical protein